jgi:hypothetical protein
VADELQAFVVMRSILRLGPSLLGLTELDVSEEFILDRWEQLGIYIEKLRVHLACQI